MIENIQLWIEDEAPKHLDALLPEERECLKNSARAQRIQQFSTGRAVAHEALKALGCLGHKAPILRGVDGAPVWPESVVGSIAHTRGAAVALVAWQKDYSSLGVDIELRSRCLSQAAIARIAASRELMWIGDYISDLPEAHERAMLLFCAKESVFKALNGRIPPSSFRFREVILDWETTTNCFVGHFAGYQHALQVHIVPAGFYVVACVALR